MGVFYSLSLSLPLSSMMYERCSGTSTRRHCWQRTGTSLSNICRFVFIENAVYSHIPTPSLSLSSSLKNKQNQMIVDILHPGRANVAKSELQEVVGSMYKADPKLVVLFGFRTKFGGGKSTGFCLIYDNENSLRKFEPTYRQVRLGLVEKKEQSRKAMKEAKNKGLKIRGTGASIAKHKAKRAAGNE